MAVLFKNNATATLATGINGAATTIVVTAGQGALFPSIAGGDYFYATLVDSSNNQEIVKVTARSTDTLTVLRGQDGTAARSFIAGDRIELRLVAAALNGILVDANAYTDTEAGSQIQAHVEDTSGAHVASAIAVTPAGNIAATDVQAALQELDTEKVATSVTVTGTGGLTGGGALSSNLTLSIASGSNGYGTRTVSTATPSGGSDGDIWYQV